MLYKFFSANSGPEAVSRLRDICDKNTLMASNPTSFNDPFEFKVSIDLDAEEEVMRDRYFADNPNARRADYERWRAGLTPNFKWSLAQETRRQLLSSFGVICFTTTVDNHLLWSHYASKHQTFCVGFDELIAEDLPAVQCWGPITYQDRAPKFRYYYDPPDAFVGRAFLFKSDCWGYEREYRIILARQGLVTFKEHRVREVILGCRAYGELREYADTRLRDRHTAYFQMAEDFNAYSLSKIPIEPGVTIMSSHF